MTEHHAAKPKGQRAPQDQPVREPMRGERRITKAPSTDQKRVRRQLSRKTAGDRLCYCGHPLRNHEPAGDYYGEDRGVGGPHVCTASGCSCDRWEPREEHEASRKTATELPVSADRLNPGDYIRGPNNQVVQVRQVRNHKTDPSQVYVDTEAGTVAVPRSQNFTMVPGGIVNRQQELPRGLGLPGGNSNMLPGAPNAGGMSPGEAHGAHKCPIDGSNMQLRNQGGSSVYVCPQDGYSMPAANFGFGPPGGGGVTTDPNALNSLAALDRTASFDVIDHCKYCGEPQVGYARRGGKDWVRCSNGHAYPADEPDVDPHEMPQAVQRHLPPGLGALDDAPADECRLCGGRLRGVGSNTARCEDCGTEVAVQRKHQTASRYFPGPGTYWSDACLSGDGVGCDGFIPSDEQHASRECACGCHKDYAPRFETNDDVRAYHRDLPPFSSKTAVGVPPVHMGLCDSCGARGPVVSWERGDHCKQCSLTHLNRISSDHSDGSRYRQVAAHFDNFTTASKTAHGIDTPHVHDPENDYQYLTGDEQLLREVTPDEHQYLHDNGIAHDHPGTSLEPFGHQHHQASRTQKTAREGDCPECLGHGNVHGRPCEMCKGTGREEWARFSDVPADAHYPYEEDDRVPPRQSKYVAPQTSAIARRAQAVLAQEETS